MHKHEPLFDLNAFESKGTWKFAKSEKSIKRGKVKSYATKNLEGFKPNSFNQSWKS